VNFVFRFPALVVASVESVSHCPHLGEMKDETSTEQVPNGLQMGSKSKPNEFGLGAALVEPCCQLFTHLRYSGVFAERGQQVDVTLTRRVISLDGVQQQFQFGDHLCGGI
jgi:hypothetical protein